MAYSAVLDLTQRGVTEQKVTEGEGTFAPPEPKLPHATVDDLPDFLQEGIKAMDWPGLMPVQAEAMPYILDERDLIVQSRTGSGKTGAFLLPLLDLLDPEEPGVQALVLCPTRELAKQIHGEFERMNSTLEADEKLHAMTVYGGVGYGPQLDALNTGVQLVVGTPGRVLDLLDRGDLNLDHLRVFALDEADEMLSMGFYPDMKKVKRFLPKDRQSLMFSATMPPKVQAVGREFLKEPAFLSLSGGTIHVDIMTHRAFEVDRMEKDRALAALIELEDAKSAIVFANTRRDVDYLTEYLQNAGYDAAGISSDLTQTAREEVMGRLRSGDLRILVATDVAARGIDVTDLTHVFQVDVPQDQEYYIHRAGRTARAGKTGTSISFVTSSDKPMLKQIAGRYGIELLWEDLPTDSEVSEKVSERLVKLLETRYRKIKQLDRERIALFAPLAERLVKDGEPELLAMLLRDVAQRAKHHGDPFATVAKPKRAARLEDDNDGDGRSNGKSGGRGKGRNAGGRR